MSKLHEIFASHVYLKCSCEEVFIILTSPSVFPFFLKEIQEVKTEKSQLEKIGDSYMESRLLKGKIVWSEIFVTEIEPPNRVAYTSDLKVVSATYVYNLESNDKGCVLTLKAYSKSKNFFGRMILPIINNIIRKQDADQLIFFKNYIEISTKDTQVISTR